MKGGKMFHKKKVRFNLKGADYGFVREARKNNINRIGLKKRKY